MMRYFFKKIILTVALFVLVFGAFVIGAEDIGTLPSAGATTGSIKIVKNTTGGNGGSFTFTSANVSLNNFFGPSNPLIIAGFNGSTFRIPPQLLAQAQLKL